jgi:hypothetical protein
VSNQPEASKKRKRRTYVVAPTNFAVPVILNAGKIGATASDVVLLGAKKFGTAGTGTKISELTGLYADRAARSAIGGGTKLLGGKGIVGGNAKLDLVAKLTAGAVIVAAGTIIATNQYRAQVRQDELDALETVPCERCGAQLVELTIESQTTETCVICGHVNIIKTKD